MAEYIDRDKIIDKLEELQFNAPVMTPVMKIYNVIELIQDQDIADVEEIKHGYWIDKPTGRYCHIGSYCSVCQEKSGIGGIESNRHKPYCPNCGARMDSTPQNDEVRE